MQGPTTYAVPAPVLLALHDHPGRIAVVFARRRGVLAGDSTWFVLSPETRGADLIILLRRKMRLEPKQAIFLFCGRRLVPMQTRLVELWTQCSARSATRCIRLDYDFENTFG